MSAAEYRAHTLVWNKIRKLRSDSGAGVGTGDFFLARDPALGNKPTLLGFPFKITNQIPTNLSDGTLSTLSEIYFGSWDQLMVGEWGGLEIAASDQTSDAFEKNQVHVRVIQEVDVAPRHNDDFAVANDVASS